jgi:hypothetical protein
MIVTISDALFREPVFFWFARRREDAKRAVGLSRVAPSESLGLKFTRCSRIISVLRTKAFFFVSSCLRANQKILTLPKQRGSRG